MSILREEEKARWKEIKDKPFKYKFDYFMDYYKWHVIGAIVAILVIVAVIRTIVSYRDYALCVIMVNTEAITTDELAIDWASDLEELLNVDTGKEQVYIDSSIMIGNGTNPNIEYAAMQKLTAYLTSATIDVFIADSYVFEQYCQNRNLYDLRDIFTEEELESMSDIIYYTDAATYSDYDDVTNLDVAADQAKYVIDHHDPASMKDPVPMGLFVTDTSRLGSTEAYSTLENFDDYQGYPSEAIIGITRNTTHFDSAVAAMKYFLQ